MARPATAAVRLLTGEREPVRLATTANITLSGLQTIDGVLTEVGDRVLVKNQTDKSENGIYTASAGAWYRAADARTARTMQKGTTVHVQQGTVAASHVYSFQTFEPEIGVDDIVLGFMQSDDTIGAVNAAIGSAATSAVEAVQQQLADEVAAAEAAAAEAAGYAAGVNLPSINPGDAGKQLFVKTDESGYELDDAATGGGFATKALAAAYAPSTAPEFLRTAGYTVAGDGGGALYKKVASEPSHAGKLSIMLSDAVTVVWYELAESFINVKMFGATGDGATDDRASCQAAIDYMDTAGGGTLWFPEGTYKIDGIAGPDAPLLDGLIVPFYDFQTTNRICLFGLGDARLLAGLANTWVLKLCRVGTIVRGLTIDGGWNYGTGITGTYGIGIVPEDGTQTTTLVSQSFTQVHDCVIEHCEEALLVYPGPSLTDGSGSGCFYLSIEDNVFNFNKRAMYFTDATNDGTNRATRSVIKNNRIVRGNTGIQLEYTTEFDLFANYFELMNASYSATPNTSGTAIVIGELTENTNVWGGYAEAVEVIIDNRATVKRNNKFWGLPTYLPKIGMNDAPQFDAEMIMPTLDGIEYYRGLHHWKTTPTGTTIAIMTPSQFRPGVDNTMILGAAGLRWSQVFAATGTINTSDAREKDWRGDLDEAEIRIAKRLSKLIGIYRWKDAIAEKGDGARLHAGVTVQDVMAEFVAEGLDPFDYGMVCYDEWETDERLGVTAGGRYGLRYDELWAFVAAGFEARLAALEA